MTATASAPGGIAAGFVAREKPAPVGSGFDITALVRDYGDVEAEVAACRTAAAVFDFSFVSAARVSGPGGLLAVAALTDRRLDDLAPGRIRYALCRDPEGWLRSDLTVWNEGDDCFLVVSGASGDIDDLVAAARAGSLSVAVDDLRGRTAVFSVQGPQALRALDGLTDIEKLASVPYYGFIGLDVAGIPCRIGRLGYTGEKGFEIVLDAGRGEELWRILAARIRPAGFAAVDCLRIEAGFVLFAHEFSLPVTAVEAGLGRFSEDDSGSTRCRLACFRAESDQPPVLWRPLKELAPPEPGTITVTSACYSALARGVLGLGYVPAGETGLDRRFVDPSGRFRAVRTAPLPFYDTAKRRPRGAWR